MKFCSVMMARHAVEMTQQPQFTDPIYDKKKQQFEDVFSYSKNSDQISIATFYFRWICFMRQNGFIFLRFQSQHSNQKEMAAVPEGIVRSRPETSSWNAQQKSSYASDVPFPIHQKIEWDQIPTNLTK